MTYHEILHTILLNLKKILKVTIWVTAFLFLILFFIYPVTYTSTVTILPPDNEPQFGGLGSLLGEQGLSSFMLGGVSNANSQLYSEILKSRSAALYVVKKNNLVKFYNEDNVYKAVKDLDKNLNIEITKEGIIKLSVDVTSKLLPAIIGNKDSVKNLSADLSNSFVEALDKINREKMTSKAKKAREYIETQLKTTKVQLDSVENALTDFQKKNKTVSLPDQVSAAIDAAAKIKSEIVSTEMQIGLLETNLREDNKSLINLKSKLDQLKIQYTKMELGNKDYLIAFKDVPELGKNLANLLREVKIQNEVYMMLQQQYYKEKIQENRDLPTVQTLDKAIPPLNASGPRVVFSTVAGGIFTFLLMSFLVLLGESKKNFKNKVEGNEIV